MDRDRIPGLIPGKRHPDWQIIYEKATEENLPWHFPQLDPDIRHELESTGTRLKILDIGCGLGHQRAELSL